MGPTQGPYILQLSMGPSYFLGGLIPPDSPLISHTCHSPQLSVPICCGQLPLLKKGAESPNFWPMSIVAKWLDGSTYHLPCM